MKARLPLLLWLAPLTVVVLSGAVVCGSEEPDPLPPADATVTISMIDNLFEPSTLRAQVGEVVAVTVINDGLVIHNMRVLSEETEGRDYESKQVVGPGEEDTFKFRFSAPGTYDFQCDFHLPDMVGTIVVE